MELPVYKYQPLRRGQIRVLQILNSATICMTHVDLGDSSPSRKYAALSYTWGASTETFPLECDKQNLPVRANLLHALSQLQHLVETPLWIDAICINQADEEEKLSQIQMMKDIYKSAARAFVSDN